MLGRKNEGKVLDVDASLQGNLIFKDAVNLHINGNFEGKLETKGDLLIGEHATVKANIVGERITIAGGVTGDVTALSELRLTSTARVAGNLQTPVITMERGSVFQGNCRMLAEEKNAESGARRVYLNPEEVAHYLSVESSLISQWAENGKLPGKKDGNSWRFDKQRIDEWIANGRIT